jgi:AAA15 family ATPase/GTPase
VDKKITETLEIHDFFSIKYIKWEIKHFNIITGDMGAGKSICIKLLKFFEDIIPSLLILPYDIFIKNLDASQCFLFITKKFTDFFDFLLPMSDNRYPF